MADFVLSNIKKCSLNKKIIKTKNGKKLEIKHSQKN
jgi:hypothetical protein